MTCIVGIEDKNKVHIWADCFLGHSGLRDLMGSTDKVFFPKYNRSFLIGCTGNMRILHLIKYLPTLKIQQIQQDDEEYLSLVFMSALQEQFEKYKFTDEDNDWSLLVGYNKKLYKVFSNFQVNRSVYGYSAMGSGYQYALGSFCTTQDSSKYTVADRLELALSAADIHCPYVSQPFIRKTL